MRFLQQIFRDLTLGPAAITMLERAKASISALKIDADKNIDL